MREDFRKLYPGEGPVRMWRAPGRVNLIGEHTDYNMGLVLPIALDLATVVASAAASAPASGGFLTVRSEMQNETVRWPVADLQKLAPRRHWSDYVAGVAQQLTRLGLELKPADLLIRSTVPDGAGLSSSAALEVSAALALLDGRDIGKLELARLCQRAENEFVGVPSGIMDQYVAVFGRAQCGVEIDCRSLRHEYVELPQDAAILAVNTLVTHALGDSAYRERTEQCAAAVEALRQQYPEVRSLRDVSQHQLEQVPLPAVIMRRARHVVSEIARVELFVSAARRGDLERMGELFSESHVSLQHDYEVSCPELDFLVDAAEGIEGVYGARMTGGGFGGCTVNLMRPDVVDHFTEEVTREYRERFGKTPLVFRCVASDGAGEI